ncbi:MAG: hypothetical protein KAH32_00485 [Chlamydiia bacterium]|nr:hypothetical protein [Chlamydiia bacterium]
MILYKKKILIAQSGIETDALISASKAKLNGNILTNNLSKTTDVSASSGGLGGLMSGGSSGGAGAAIGAVGEIGAGLISKDAGIDYDNIDKEVDQDKMAMGAAVSGAAKGAQMGMAFGPWGAAIGGVVGGAAGYLGGKKAAKEAAELQHKLVVERDENKMDVSQGEEAERSNRAAANVSSKYSSTGKAIVAREGTKFSMHLTGYSLPITEVTKVKRTKTKPFKTVFLRKGGKVDASTNIIPDGVSHEEENSMGTKGMPVVKCTKTYCSKVYEIESDELILTVKATKEIEKLAKNKDRKKLGEFMANQIMKNTHSYTDTFDL